MLRDAAFATYLSLMPLVLVRALMVRPRGRWTREDVQTLILILVLWPLWFVVFGVHWAFERMVMDGLRDAQDEVLKGGSDG